MKRRGVAVLCAIVAACASPDEARVDGGAPEPAAPSPAPPAPAPAPVVPSHDAAAAEAAAAEASPPCPDEMAHIDAFCIDRWEDHVVTIDASGAEHVHPPNLLVDGLFPVARSAEGVMPQAYISQTQAARACANAGKRLCTQAEFVRACRGPNEDDLYPYGGREKKPGYCNEGKGSAIFPMFGSDPKKWTYANFNDPRLNAAPATNLAKTGAYAKCVSPEGVYDLVGNVHEWGADGMDAYGRGRFRGGFYGDAEVNGHGCLYVTKAHEPTYHDYSTGFRCCMDEGGVPVQDPTVP